MRLGDFTGIIYWNFRKDTCEMRVLLPTFLRKKSRWFTIFQESKSRAIIRKKPIKKDKIPLMFVVSFEEHLKAQGISSVKVT